MDGAEGSVGRALASTLSAFPNRRHPRLTEYRGRHTNAPLLHPAGATQQSQGTVVTYTREEWTKRAVYSVHCQVDTFTVSRCGAGPYPKGRLLPGAQVARVSDSQILQRNGSRPRELDRIFRETPS
jgi:hypothetical protein